jgi:hypothetical protein
VNLLRKLTVAGCLLGVAAFCLLSSLPGFLADQQHSKQAECHRNLATVMSRFAELRDGGVELPALMAALPPDRPRYTYVFGDGASVPPTKKPPAEAERLRELALVKSLVDPGLRGKCPDCQLTVACVGNTDDDDELDLISVSSVDRYVFGDLRVAAGETYLQQSDYASDPALTVRFEKTDAGR